MVLETKHNLRLPHKTICALRWIVTVITVLLSGSVRYEELYFFSSCVIAIHVTFFNIIYICNVYSITFFV